MTIAEYDAKRPAKALSPVHTLCHAPFAVMDLGPQGQVTTCNHFHRFIGNLHTQSWLDIFRGEDWSRLRRNMLDYKISEMDCRHCSRQIRSGHPGNAFAQEHFDGYPAVTTTPQYPTVIIFRLSNVCNLMCVMCNGTLSHRIRKERENLPPLPPPPYDEKFFQEMEETLPHVKYVEFYGGEPFLVKEHLRILDIIEKTGAKTEIYVNTNATSFTPRVKEYIEKLNFVKVAASVDAIHDDIHGRQRVGIKHDVCMENVRWLLELRKRKNIWIGLNTTETRFNWYHLPVMYEWAAERDVYVHINTCLHPSDTTIYDLPTEEIAYIDDYFERWKHRLGAKLEVRGNRQSYGHLQAMVRDELSSRHNGSKRPNPYPTDRDPIHGGMMWVPELRRSPIATPAEARAEIAKVQEFAAWDFAHRMAQTWLRALADSTDSWAELRPELEALESKAAPLATAAAKQRAQEEQRRVLRTASGLEQAGKYEQALASLCGIGEESPHFGAAELLRARILRRTGALDRAADALQRAFARQPTDAATFVELAWLSFDTGDIEAGRTHARRARDLAGADPERGIVAAWAHALGALALRAGDKIEAQSALRALEQVNPSAPITHEMREAVDNFDTVRARLAIESAWRLERAGRFEDAIKALSALPAEGPLAYEAAIPHARALRRSGHHERARHLLEQAANAQPMRPEALVEMAWMAYDANRLDAGLELARHASTLGGSKKAWAHVMAVLAVAAGHSEAACEALAQLHDGSKLPSRHHPEGELADQRDRDAVARAWQHEGRSEYAECEQCIESVGNHSPHRLEALVVRARIQRRRGDLVAARRTLALALAIAPVQLEALIELAWMGLDHDVPGGLRFAQRAMELSLANQNPLGVVTWAYPLGRLAAASGDRAALDLALSQLSAVSQQEPMAKTVAAELAAC